MTNQQEPEDTQTIGTLKEGEFHPAANSAMAYIQGIPPADLLLWAESLASTALSGSRLAEICTETLDRVMTGKPVSDRYLLGLGFTLMILEMEKGREAEIQKNEEVQKP